MKIGISVSTYPTKFGPIVFSGDNTAENLKTVKELGYHGVDLFMNNKTEAEIEELGSVLETLQIEISMFIAIYLAEKGVNLSDRDEKKRKKAVLEYKNQILVAKKLKALSMPIGLIRGRRLEDEEDKAFQERLAKSLCELSEFACEKSMPLYVEPVNRYEINTLNSVEQTLEFLEKYNLTALKLLPDTFHMNIEDKSLEKAIELAANRIGHVHVADSNRQAPGQGHVNYSSLLRALNKVGYNGYLTIEALPLPNPLECARQGITHLNRHMNTND